MKKTVKIMSMAIIVIMLMCMLPMGAFALSETKTVTSLEIVSNDYVYIENDMTTGGYVEDEQTGLTVYGYDPYESFYDLEIKINYSDSSSEIFCYGDYMDSDVSYDAVPDIAMEYWDYIPWKIGGNNYYVVEYKGVKLNVPVTIVESPVESIEILENKYQFIEGEHGVYTEYEDGTYTYNPVYAILFGLKLKVNYKDNTSVTYSPSIYDLGLENLDPDNMSEEDYYAFLEAIYNLLTIDGHLYTIDFMEQFENPWKVGEDNSFTFYYKGYELKIPATVINTPVESIEVLENPFKYTKEDKKTGYWDMTIEEDDVQFVYKEAFSLAGLKLKINYNDGSSEIYNMREQTAFAILNDHEFTPISTQYELPWVEGNENSYLLHYMGVSVEVDATVIDPEAIDATKKFTDVGDKWYTEYVNYAVNYGLFNGTSDNTFAPNSAMNRAMFVQVLANLAGAKTDRMAKTQFDDVVSNKWYTGAVKWAADNGIVTGTGKKTFEPMKNITREQMCTMLVRFANYMNLPLEKINDKEYFSDDSKISNYAIESVYECQMAGLVNGMGDGKFAPKETATRAQVSKILSVFHDDYFTVK